MVSANLPRLPLLMLYWSLPLVVSRSHYINNIIIALHTNMYHIRTNYSYKDHLFTRKPEIIFTTMGYHLLLMPSVLLLKRTDVCKLVEGNVKLSLDVKTIN